MRNCTPLWREAHLEVKSEKNYGFGAVLEVEMSKKCMPLWCEAHFQVKMYKTQFGPLLEVEMSKKCTPLWRQAHFEVKSVKTPGFGPLFDDSMAIRCRISARPCGEKHI